MEVGQKFHPIQTDLTSTGQAFNCFQHFRQSRRPVQTDPVFAQQMCQMKSQAKVETV